MVVFRELSHERMYLRQSCTPEVAKENKVTPVVVYFKTMYLQGAPETRTPSCYVHILVYIYIYVSLVLRTILACAIVLRSCTPQPERETKNQFIGRAEVAIAELATNYFSQLGRGI